MDNRCQRILFKGHLDIPEPELKPLTQVGDLVWVLGDEYWGIVKVEKINPPCIACQSGYIWNNWLPLEVRPLYNDLKEQIQ